MFYRNFLLFFLLSFISAKSFSAVFVVTSNADAGPGTLREALTLAAANGSTTQDLIQFNIPDVSVAGRTITLASQLPDLSPNIMIDGTTQPGASFGVSDAKVKIFNNFTPAFYTQPPYIFNGSNLGNFTISGLYLDALTFDGQPNAFAISVTNSDAITIDHCLMPGGNINISDCNSLSFKSNMVGYLPDGITGFPTAINVANTLNVAIGGNPSEGNLLSGSLSLNMYDPDKDWIYVISNNKMGTDYTGTSSSPQLYSQGRIVVESGHYNPPGAGKMHGTIADNMIENFSTTGIVVSGFGDVSIKGNSIETDKTGKINFYQFAPDYVKNSLGWAPTAIILQVGVDATVGGTNPGDANIIANVSNGILEQLANQVVISQNSIFCINSTNFNIHDFVTQAYTKPLPFVQINTFTNNSISGTATPGARVELFSNTEGTCASCEPRDFFTYVAADAQGNWSYTGFVPPNVVASAIYNNQTSHFTKATVDIKNLKVTQAQCGSSNGAIQGVKFYNAGQSRWIDQDGNVISNSLDINNLPPGKYKFKVGSDVCGAESGWIEIIDNSLKIDAANVKLKNASCNIGGSISGLTVTTYKNEKFDCVWTDGSLKQVGSTLDVSNLLAGAYTLKVTGLTTGCAQTYGPFVLSNVSGPNIDQSHINIQSTNCGQSAGSITNMQVTGTGTLKYSWTNSQQQQVGTDKDLVNQPAGTYKLQVTDDSQCGPIFTTDIAIPETNGIALDESKVQATAASCSADNGAITGIQVTGNAQYKWVDANGKVVATTLDLNNAAPGDYTFTAYNAAGCSQTSATYPINLQPPTQFPVYNDDIVFTCIGQSNGSVSVKTDAVVKALRWTDSQGQTIGTGQTLENLSAGTYKLYLTDMNGCESYYDSYNVSAIPQLAITPNSAQVTNDQCALKTGSIKNVQVTGGIPPYSYSWVDGNGVVVSTTPGIAGLGQGDYTLSVTDGSGCNIASLTYNIEDQSTSVPAPAAGDIELCTAGDAMLRVSDARQGYSYRLYDSETSDAPLDANSSGIFRITATASKSFFISRLSGSCESMRTEVRVTVGITAFNIPNVFTPNGDGINDLWDIPGLESSTSVIVQVFTRYGQKVFESRGYTHPFDGTSGGKPIPTGVYYYIINLGANCNILSGSLTVIR